MKHTLLTTITISITTPAFSLVLTKASIVTQVTTPAITAPPSLASSAPSLGRTLPWIDSDLSSRIARPFSGLGIDANLSSYCVAAQYRAYSSQYSHFLKLTPTPQPTTNTITYLNSSLTTYTRPFSFPYYGTYTSPCCGYCTPWAYAAQIVYWPTPNPYPGITTMVDSTGFTYSSPSAYVKFSGLQVDNFCGHNKVGTLIHLTTLAFQPTELSTIRKTYGEDQNIGTYQMDFRQWETDCTAIPGIATASDGVVGVWDPCRPILAIPSKVVALQSAWSTCVPVKGATGPLDPPSALTPVAGGLTPITLPQSTMTTPALPSSTPEPVPSITTASSPSSITSTRINTVPSRTGLIDPSGPLTSISTSASAGSSSSNSNNSPIGSQTTNSGQSVIRITSTPVSTGAAGIVVAGSTIPLTTASALATVAGQPITAVGPSGIFDVARSTLRPGGPPVTVSGIPVYLDPSGVLVIGTSTITPSMDSIATRFFVGSDTFTVDPPNVAVGRYTLTAGSPGITVGGVFISLGYSDLVLESKTENFALQGTASTGGLGEVVISGLGEISESTIRTESTSTTAGIELFSGMAANSVPMQSISRIVIIILFWTLCFAYI